MFPVEIWEEILQYCDPADLVRFQRVCRTWCAIIQSLLERPLIWYKKCEKDVPYYFWELILAQQNFPEVDWWDFHRAANHPHVWESLYRSYVTWRRLVHRPHVTLRFEPVPDHRPMERITCMDALTDTIAIGTSEGFATIFDTSATNISKIDRAVFLLDLKLWTNKDNQTIVSTVSVNKEVVHWNVQQAICEAQGKAMLLSAGCGYCYALVRNRLCRMSAGFKHSESTTVMDSEKWDLPYFGKAVAMCGDLDEVIMWTDINQCIKFGIKNNKHQRVKISAINDPSIDTRRYQFFRPNIISCIGERGEFGFSVAGRDWEIYSLFRKFHAAVTAVLFHVGVLVLGLDSGEIRIFPVDDIYSLESLNFDTLPSERIMLASIPIISLRAMENHLYHYIIAASERRVYIVRFESL